MNFLQICEELSAACSIPSAPTTVVAQTGELKRVVGWAKQAWIDIQLRHIYWNFLLTDLSFVTIANQGSYTPTEMGAADLRELDYESLKIKLTSIGVSDEQRLVMWPYEAYRDTYEFGIQTADRPVLFSVDPKGRNTLLGPKPSSALYTVTGRYWRTPVTLALDDDTPAMPSEFHQLIVHRALMKYAGYEAAPEAKQFALEEYAPMMRALERDQLSAVGFGGPLA